MRPTIKSIASRLGISHATVSMALRENPLVKAETREQIKKTARELGYVPNGIAQAMRTRHASTLGVIVGNLGNSYTGAIVEGIENEAQKRGYRCLICQTHESSAELEEEIRVLETHRSAGLIIQVLDFESQSEFYGRTLPSMMPCVFCDGDVPGFAASSVLSDSRNLGFLAAWHLIGLGHRRIACLLGPDRNARERFKGYCRALKKGGVEADGRLVVYGGWGFEAGARAARELIERRAPFTALVASSDPVAVAAMKVFAREGLRIPDDVSVIGAGNHDFAGFVSPSLTSIEQFPGEIGRRTVDALFDRIKDPVSPFERHTIKPRLIVRESTAPAGSGK
ncbi:MAG: LacI family DNA-binding transcriptional regulator [Terrimicrobiaceae bacterium]